MKLYGSARSSAAFRVRIALHLKGVPWTWVPVRLSAAEHREEGFTALNPAQLVPLLVDGPHRLTQSLAIIEYLERTQPGPALLPADPVDCAYVRACALAVACEVHPLNNLRALDYLRQEAGLDEAAVGRWYAHWIDDGLHKLEVLLADQRRHGRFLLGDTPTMADAVLVPQIFNAQRWGCELGAFPRLMQIFDACMGLPAFEDARPERQPDF